MAEPNNTLLNAQSIGNLSTFQITDFIGSTDNLDYYKFYLPVASYFSATLSGITQSYVYAKVIYDANSNNSVDYGETLYSNYASTGSNATINQTLGTGTYFIQVSPDSGVNTNYTLRLGATAAPPTTPRDPGNNLSNALDLGTLYGTKTFTEFVGTADSLDFYKFYLPSNTSFSLTLNGITQSYVYAKVIYDANGNNSVDYGDTLYSDYASTGSNATINQTLGIGTYFIQVSPDSGVNTNYTLSLTGPDQPYGASSWQMEGTGDFNRDGNVDILWHNTSTNQNGAWLMNSGGANIGWQGMASNPTGWDINGTGDFNRDGNIDILWHNPSTNQNGAWLMNSNGANIGWQSMASNPTGWDINGTGDFNRDGNIDILWHNASTNQNGAWLMNSNGANIGWQSMASNPTGWVIQQTGDFNRDGNIDILWHNYSTNQNGAWLMNSNGANIGWQGMAGNPSGWDIQGTGDFNRDGNLDILWHNSSTNQNGAWLMNSGGSNIGWQGMSPNP
ncbi:FG-GAP repeat domain-containing protein [Nostoc sp. C117]|uniref:FG-GAP repeat domain-containing protein n=1 Tax=Nostoc sp. C117 TaxID=3349875 RepID=UPI00370D6B4E